MLFLHTASRGGCPVSSNVSSNGAVTGAFSRMLNDYLHPPKFEADYESSFRETIDDIIGKDIFKNMAYSIKNWVADNTTLSLKYNYGYGLAGETSVSATPRQLSNRYIDITQSIGAGFGASAGATFDVNVFSVGQVQPTAGSVSTSFCAGDGIGVCGTIGFLDNGDLMNLKLGIGPVVGIEVQTAASLTIRNNRF